MDIAHVSIVRTFVISLFLGDARGANTSSVRLCEYGSAMDSDGYVNFVTK